MHPPQQQPQQWPPAPPQPYGQPTQHMQPPPGQHRPPTKSGVGRGLAVAGGVVLALAVIGGLLKLTGGEDETAASPSASASPTAGAERVVAAEPTRSQQRAYLAALKEIDPGLTVNPTRVMRRAGRVCDRLLNEPDGLPKYTVLELSGGNATIDEDQAKQVIDAVAAWCRPA
ncbi:hypothetical protein [Streptosporangium sp. NPDC087985]|uniref:hypothetical protein n=1 Tax=Streptosporangium sp. NPDC087985 TaxID=3366196 RepID=UPI0038016BD3